MSRTRSFPAENGSTGHQMPIVRTNVSKVCRTSLRTMVDCRTGGRRRVVTAAPEVLAGPELLAGPGSGVWVMRASWIQARVVGHHSDRVQVVTEAVHDQRPQRGELCSLQIDRTGRTGQTARTGLIALVARTGWTRLTGLIALVARTGWTRLTGLIALVARTGRTGFVRRPPWLTRRWRPGRHR
jgi:hypothetical protein